MAKRITVKTTAYGPPWNSMEGGGITSTGIPLKAGQQKLVVAVDPTVIPYGTKLRIPGNPFGNDDLVFTAADTGGAFQGGTNKLDFFIAGKGDEKTHDRLNKWGVKDLEAFIVGKGSRTSVGTLEGQLRRLRGESSGKGGSGGGGAQRALAAPDVSLTGSSGGSGMADYTAALLAASGVGEKQQAQVQSSGLATPGFSAGAVLPNGAKLDVAALSSGAPQVKTQGPDVQALLAQLPSVDTSVPGVAKIKSAAELVEAAGGVPKSQQVGGKAAPAAGGRAGGAVAWATGKLGHFAESTGSNTGDELDKLQARFGMRGQAWCAMFATTAAAQGGMSRSGRSARVEDVRNWASAGRNGYAKLVNGAHAGPGDLLMWGNDHIALVVANKNGNLSLIQGNGSSGKVDRRSVSASEARGLQAARPVYSKKR